LFLCLSFFFGSLFLSSVGRMIFGSRAVTARRRKPRDRQTDRQKDRQRQTDTDRQRQTTRERERHEHSHSVMHTQVSGFKISAVSVFRNSAWLPLSGGSQVGRALFLDGLSHRSLHWFRHQNK